MRATFDEIIQSMKKAYKAELGEEVMANSIEEKKLQAVASELYALSCYGDFILKQAFVQTASGEYLDMHAALRNCERKRGTKAKGVLNFGVYEESDSDIIIEKGTVCSKIFEPLIQYTTDETAVLKAGEKYVTVACTALENGEKYNAEIGEVCVLVNPPSKIGYAENYKPINGGSDDENDNTLRQRVINTFKIPLNFFNKNSIEVQIRNIEDYKDCSIKQSDEAGKVKVVISCPRTLGDDDLTKVKQAFPQAELFGVEIQLEEAKKTHVSIKVKANVDIITDKNAQKKEIYDNLYEILTRNKINYNIQLDELRKAALKIDGVQSIEISGTNVSGECIICGDNSYILLDNLEVELYER